MKKLILFIVSLFVATTVLQSQKTEEGYDAFFKPAKSGWRYYVITEKKDNLWYREAYYLPEKSMAMTGWYKDKDCKIPEGTITWYYTNKNPMSSINYKNGKEEGITLKFHDNGMMSDSSNYTNGHRNGISLGWDSEGNQVDSTNFDGKGNGVAVYRYAGGAVSSAGRFINDTTKINRWIYYHRNGKVMAIEDYVNGTAIHCSCSDEQGNPIDSSLCVEKEAHFTGEDAGWIKFLQKNLNPNVPVNHRASEGEYTVVVQFVVDKNGDITDIKPLTKFGFGMEDEVIRILKKSPQWIPARQYGRNVKAYRKQPITFVVEKN